MANGIVRRALNALVLRQSPRHRQAKLGPIAEELQSGLTVLDIGVWCRIPEHNPSDNWLEKQDPGTGRLVAVGIEGMSEFSKVYPHVHCVQADATALPFADGSIDVAASNAVLEHVLPEKQQAFVNDIARVARRRAWFSVPDRLCPVEIHTRLPLVHWLPWWRKMFTWLGHENWSMPEHLSLLSLRAVKHLLARPQGGSWRVKRLHFLLIPVSLIAEYTADGSTGHGPVDEGNPFAEGE